MESSLLQTAESLRATGSCDDAVTALRTVIRLCNNALEDADDSAPDQSCHVQDQDQDQDQSDDDEELSEKQQIRALALYQLAVLLLQGYSGTPSVSPSPSPSLLIKEADFCLFKLGFCTRLHSNVLNYDLNHFNRARAPLPLPLPLPLPPHTKLAVVYDNVFSPSVLSALTNALISSEIFWSYHNYPTSTFFSYNFGHPNPQNQNQNLLSQIALDGLLPLLLPHYPSLVDCTSVEIWAHRRDGEGHHQLHYDLDERLLVEGKGELKDRVRSPIVSSVFYLDVVDYNHGGGVVIAGAPTLVCDKKISVDCFKEDQSDSEEDPDMLGAMVYPKINRVLAFDGSLLHCVVPGNVVKPSDSEGEGEGEGKGEHLRRRVTLMFGFWKDVSTSDIVDETTLAPNMIGKKGKKGKPIPGWMNDKAFSSLSPTTTIINEACVESKDAAEHIESVWANVEVDEAEEDQWLVNDCEDVGERAKRSL